MCVPTHALLARFPAPVFRPSRLLANLLFQGIKLRSGKEFSQCDFKSVAQLLDRNCPRIFAFSVEDTLNSSLRNIGDITQPIGRDAALST